MAGLRPATNSMVRKDVATVTLPCGLAAGFRKKADPDEDVITVRTKGVPRANAIERKIADETIQIRIIDRPVPKDHRDVHIKAVSPSALLNGDVRSRRYLVHKFNLPPDPIRGASINEGVQLARR